MSHGCGSDSLRVPDAAGLRKASGPRTLGGRDEDVTRAVRPQGPSVPTSDAGATVDGCLGQVGGFAEVRVREQSIVSARLASDDYLLLVASAEARRQVGMARPEGAGQRRTTLRVPIKGRRAWLELARTG